MYKSNGRMISSSEMIWLNLVEFWPLHPFLATLPRSNSVRSTIRDSFQDELFSLLGMGVNISNAQPSVCLNDAIAQQKTTSTLTPFTTEEFIGRTVGYFQHWISQLSQSNILQATIAVYNFYQIYQSLWMHQYVISIDRWSLSLISLP